MHGHTTKDNNTANASTNVFLVLLHLSRVTAILMTAAPASILVENFRPVAGTHRLYRCASTDGLAQVERTRYSCSTDEDSATAVAIILSKAGLIVDLRSDSERDETQAKQWMNEHGFQAVEIWNPKYDKAMRGGGTVMPLPGDNSTKKTVLRIDVQPRERIIDYLTRHWLTPVQRGWNAIWTVTDTVRQHEMRMDVLNERGLVGLYEAILETGGSDLCLALQHITEHLEMAPDDSVVVFHCVKGKDRTGLVAMLCQSILKMTDDEIIEEYAKSECMREGACPQGHCIVTVKGRFDQKRFAGSPPQAMADTLVFLRRKYGSVCPGYLDAIGFHKPWRDRFGACHQNLPSSTSHSESAAALSRTSRL